MDKTYHVIVIGGGPAGLTAALYAARRGLKTLVVSQDIGGQAATTSTVENYPGIDVIDGLELMMKFKSQAEKYGAEFYLQDVHAIARQGNSFSVNTHGESFTAPVVIVAYGLTHRHLNVPGEEALIGKGVSYCATCDAPLYKQKTVAVIGGGNSAMDAALLLANLGSTVSLLTTKKEFHGEKVLIERIQQTPGITVITEAETKAIQGTSSVTGLTYDQAGQVHELAVQGIFVEIGFTVNPGLVQGLLELDARRQVIIHPGDNSTSVPGLYAAGDITTIGQKQIVISAGEGAKAALSAWQYLQATGQIKRTGLVDWGVSTPFRHEQTSPIKST